MNGVGEFLRLREIWGGSLAPQNTGVRRVSKTPRDSGVDAATILIKAFRCALAIDEFAVTRVRVGQQQASRVGVRASDENRRHSANVRSKTRGDELLDEFTGRHHDLATQMPAFFRG